MKKGQGDNAANGSIVIKRVKKIEGGHHGGAWKVAYADFVTAMMAFFLMLWLLSTTTKEQKEGISDYFTMALVSAATGGSDGMLGGQSLNKEKSVADGTPTITLSLGRASR
ncbi:MAG: flagellar motor protein MotB, partial [Pseudomonadota bacterium]